MPHESHQCECDVVPGFSLGEKICAHATLYGGVFAGTYGIFQSSPVVAVSYLLMVLVGFILLVRYTVCSRCPHLLEAGDCLFLGPELMRRLFSPNHTGPLHAWQYAIFFGTFGVTMLVPLWFLPRAPVPIVVCIVLMAAMMVMLRWRVCTKCHTTVCPLNARREGAAS